MGTNFLEEFNSLLERYSHKDLLINLGLFAAAIVLATCLSVLYISSERFFYFWDYGGFQGIALDQANKFSGDPQGVLLTIKHSIHLDYNYLYILPLIPFLQSFGDTRLSFVLSIVWVYQIPFVLITGAIATKLIRAPSKWVFWSTVFLGLVTPIALAPALRGYPDVGGILLVACAVLVYLHNPKLENWWQIGLIGFLIAVAIIFRRHFTYSGIAFYISAFVLAFIEYINELRRSQSGAWHGLLKSISRIGITGLVSIVTLAVLGRPLLKNMLTTDYAALYSSYSLEPIQILLFLINSYGWLTWILVVLGFAFGLSRGVLRYSVAVFIVVFGIISIILWMFVASQRSIQYTLHQTPFIVLGLSTLIWTSWISFTGKKRFFVLIIVITFLLYNAIVGLAPIALPYQISPLFSVNNRPLVRSDYDEVAGLITYLREITTVDEPIYVVDSSVVMNYDLIEQAEQAIYGRDQTKLTVLDTPQIDSRDFYPLEQLLGAKYLILSTPFQHHLPPDQQNVVRVVYDAFIEKWDISQDFSNLPIELNLDRETTLKIYKRTRTTTLQTALGTFSLMRGYFEQPPAAQPDWIMLNQPSQYSISKLADGTSYIKFNLQDFDKENPLNLLYSHTPPNNGRITGTINFKGAGCDETFLYISSHDSAGKSIGITEKTYSYLGQAQEFTIPIDAQGASIISLQVGQLGGTQNMGDCQLVLNWILITPD